MRGARGAPAAPNLTGFLPARLSLNVPAAAVVPPMAGNAWGQGAGHSAAVTLGGDADFRAASELYVKKALLSLPFLCWDTCTNCSQSHSNWGLKKKQTNMISSLVSQRHKGPIEKSYWTLLADKSSNLLAAVSLLPPYITHHLFLPK